MAKHDVIDLRVFRGGRFDGHRTKYSNTSHGCSNIIHDFDKDLMSFFELRDMLKDYGLKDKDSLYYLKPGYDAPDGLVLIMDDNQCNQLLIEHEGRSSCSLYIVPDPQPELNQDGGMDQDTSSDDDSVEDATYKHTGQDETDSSSSDVEFIAEHDIENRFVDAGAYVFEGDADDDELYSLKKQQADAIVSKGTCSNKTADNDNGSKKVTARAVRREGTQAKKNATTSSTQPEILYLSDEPNEGNLTPDEAYETPIYVHRSRGLEENWFDASTMKHPVLKVGVLFSDVKQFREAMKNLVIREGRKVEKRKNDTKQVSSRCLGEGCPWYMYGAVIPGEKTFKLSKFISEHTCGRSHDVKQMDAKWIAKEYLEDFRSDRDWKVKGLKDSVLRDTKIGISKYKAYRAKREAVSMVLGDHLEQFKRIQDYAHTLLHVNPGSKVVVKCGVSNDVAANPVFQRMFISFKAQIDGFKAGCRPFIGVDGTHVKLNTGAQILAATGRDANNNMFPIALALAESECIQSWEWFLECLKDCIGDGHEHGGWVIMSDRQKGIMHAVPKVFPTAEHRWCLRHLHANFVTAGFRGDELKKLMEAASYAYRKYDFDIAMDKMKLSNFEAWDWLRKVPPEHWSRHMFSSRGKTDLVVNNISETYNSSILEARDEPVITMLEHMRSKLMENFATKDEGARRDNWTIAPNYKKRLEWEKELASFYRPICAGRGIWQVSMAEFTFKVDLNNMTCGCRKWDVTGIPCCHAVSAIQSFDHRPEDYVDTYFKKEKYKLSYAGMIMPVPDKTQWVKTPFPDIDPPKFHKQPGRPKKKRIKAAGEPNVPEKASKRKTIRCGYCKDFGHNERGCGLKKSIENRGATTTTVGPQQGRRGWRPNQTSSQDPDASQSQPSQDQRDHIFSSSQNESQHLTESGVHFSSQPPPVAMNNDFGIGVFHQVEGGPTISNIIASRARFFKNRKRN